MSGGGADTAALHTGAWLTLEENFQSLQHMADLRHRDAVALRSAAARMLTYVKKDSSLSAPVTPARVKKVVSAIDRLRHTVETSSGRRFTINLWMVVMLVTCVEAYLQDVLSIAASVDPELMSKSEQPAHYADVLGAASLDELVADLRARWARGWLSDGGPTRWLSRLDKMGARGYPDDLALRLERIWGIRHVVVHTAGVATSDFVKRHPGVVAARGDRLRVTDQNLLGFMKDADRFAESTDAFFLARYPAIPRTKSFRAGGGAGRAERGASPSTKRPRPEPGSSR